MKKTEYVEGSRAKENFEQAMSAIFKAPKPLKHKPKKRKKGKD
jgi:hypothetical protein